MLTKDAKGVITQTISQAEADRKGYFDITRDMDYPFFCEACLVGKKESQMSEKDTRFCVDCQPVVEYEYALAAEHRNRKSGYVGVALRELDVDKEEKILLPTDLENTHEYQKVARPPLLPPRGRPRKDIPFNLIHKLFNQGLGVKQIAKELKEYKLSAMTVSRVLSGERSS